MKKSLLLAVLFTAIIGSCYYDKEEKLYPNTQNNTGCDTINVSFDTTIRPQVFDMYCNSSGCHNTASAANQVVLDNLSKAKSAYLSRNLICTMEWTGCAKMPKGSSNKIDACLVAKVKAWAHKGFPQ